MFINKLSGRTFRANGSTCRAITNGHARETDGTENKTQSKEKTNWKAN